MDNVEINVKVNGESVPLSTISTETFEQIKKTEILNKIISVANQANSLSELLTKIRDSFINLFDLKGCCIYLIDKSRNAALIKVHKGFPSYFFLENSELDINVDPYNAVFSKGVALINNNFPDVIEKFFKGLEVNSTAIIPLFSKSLSHPPAF